MCTLLILFNRVHSNFPNEIFQSNRRSNVIFACSFFLFSICMGNLIYLLFFTKENNILLFQFEFKYYTCRCLWSMCMCACVRLQVRWASVFSLKVRVERGSVWLMEGGSSFDWWHELWNYSSVVQLRPFILCSS